MPLQQDKLYKLLPGNMICHNYQYKVGHNRMGGDFFPMIGEDGGLYCWRGNRLLYELGRFRQADALIAEVTLPPDALYIEEGGIIKTEELILGEPLPAAKFIGDIATGAIIDANPLNIFYFTELTDDMKAHLTRLFLSAEYTAGYRVSESPQTTAPPTEDAPGQ